MHDAPGNDMLLLGALLLFALLLNRLGFYWPYWRHREALAFEDEVLQIVEDVMWEDRVARMPRRRHPVLQLK